MSKILFFRTNSVQGVGLGHISRCRNLASVFKERGGRSIFLVDKIDGTIAKYLNHYSVIPLYLANEEFSSQIDDADRVINIAGKLGIPSAIVVDDYRLDAKWECIVARELLAKIVAIDDVRREHKADILVDPKWQGENTYSRYDGLVDVKCLKLLGPKYFPISKDYQNLKEHKTSSENLNVVFSLGGGGSAEFIKEFCVGIINQLNSSAQINLIVILGPYIDQPDVIYELVAKYPEVVPLNNPNGLYKVLSGADFFVGAAGTTLFEALSLDIPCLSFSIVENQLNCVTDLEDIGNTFYVGFIAFSQVKKLAELAALMLLQLERIASICKANLCLKIDGRGCERIFDALECLGTETVVHDKKHDQNFEKKMHRCISIQTGFKLEILPDEKLNYYLQARNFNQNKKNMTITDDITLLDHHIWWLGPNEREFFVLKRDGCPVVYVWHKCVKATEKSFLIGGWFTACESTGGLDALNALQMQLEYTDRRYPNTPWLAVIKKTNNFTLLLNMRYGFEIIDRKHKFFDDVRFCFPAADVDSFWYLAR